MSAWCLHLGHLRIMGNIPKFPYLDSDPRDFRQHSYVDIAQLAGVPHILALSASASLGN